MQKLSDDPTIYTIENYITLEECEHMINISKDKIAPSLVSGSKSGYISKGRTGQNCWISHDHDHITSNIAERISNEVGISLKNTEAFQVIYYDVDQEYKQHYDSWDFDNSERSIRNMKYGGQRMVTALVYLNDVEEGGGTKFTKLGKEVKAEKGKLLIFHNVIKGTNIKHKMSEHAGMPVLKGEKWAFNLWFREQDKKLEYDYNEKTFENNNSIIENLDIVNDIKKYKNVLNNDELLNIIMNCYFEKKEKSNFWIDLKKIPKIINKLEKLINVESFYFENMCVTKYGENIKHGNHLDAFDISTERGLENINKRGQRQITTTGFLTKTKVTFPKINEEFIMEKGDILVYRNCYNNSNKRNDNMIKSYESFLEEVNSNELSQILLFNIYIRERKR